DNRHRVIQYRELFRGTIDGAAVYPREVVRQALEDNAAAVIFAHNHPSGVAEPSQADISLTRRLKEALGLVDIRVLDHMVIGHGEVISLVERGVMEPLRGGQRTTGQFPTDFLRWLASSGIKASLSGGVWRAAFSLEART